MCLANAFYLNSYIHLLQEMLNKAVVNISDLRTDVEEIKWDNMRRAVGSSFLPIFLLFDRVLFSYPLFLPGGHCHVNGAPT